MILDSSALVAIIRSEEDATRFGRAIQAAERPAIGAATLVEASIVVGSRHHESLDGVLRAGDVQVLAFDENQARVARAAYARFGKGSGSPARLNFGDCLAYALATTTGRPLLFKGEDFTHTDVTPALPPAR